MRFCAVQDRLSLVSDGVDLSELRAERPVNVDSNYSSINLPKAAMAELQPFA